MFAWRGKLSQRMQITTRAVVHQQMDMSAIYTEPDMMFSHVNDDGARMFAHFLQHGMTNWLRPHTEPTCVMDIF